MSPLERLAEYEFEGGGSQSESMRFLILCAEVCGNATGDPQLLGIAEGLSRMNGGGGDSRIPDFASGGRGRELTGPQAQPAPRGLIGGV